MLHSRRVDDHPIRLRSKVYNPDVVIVLDPSLLEIANPTQGLKDGGILIVNSTLAARQPEIAAFVLRKTSVVDAGSSRRKFSVCHYEHYDGRSAREGNEPDGRGIVEGALQETIRQDRGEKHPGNGKGLRGDHGLLEIGQKPISTPIDNSGGRRD